MDVILSFWSPCGTEPFRGTLFWSIDCGAAGSSVLFSCRTIPIGLHSYWVAFLLSTACERKRKAIPIISFVYICTYPCVAVTDVITVFFCFYPFLIWCILEYFNQDQQLLWKAPYSCFMPPEKETIYLFNQKLPHLNFPWNTLSYPPSVLVPYLEVSVKEIRFKSLQYSNRRILCSLLALMICWYIHFVSLFQLLLIIHCLKQNPREDNRTSTWKCRTITSWEFRDNFFQTAINLCLPRYPSKHVHCLNFGIITVLSNEWS